MRDAIEGGGACRLISGRDSVRLKVLGYRAILARY